MELDIVKHDMALKVQNDLAINSLNAFIQIYFHVESTSYDMTSNTFNAHVVEYTIRLCVYD